MPVATTLCPDRRQSSRRSPEASRALRASDDHSTVCCRVIRSGDRCAGEPPIVGIGRAVCTHIKCFDHERRHRRHQQPPRQGRPLARGAAGQASAVLDPPTVSWETTPPDPTRPWARARSLLAGRYMRTLRSLTSVPDAAHVATIVGEVPIVVRAAAHLALPRRSKGTATCVRSATRESDRA